MLNQLFQLNQEYQEGITLEDIYLNGNSTLKRLNLTSLSTEKVIINIESELDQLSFQLENENLNGFENLERSSLYDERFNQINKITNLILQPYEVKEIILGFLPTFSDLDSAQVLPGENALHSEIENLNQGNSILNFYKESTVETMIKFKATKLNDENFTSDVEVVQDLLIPFKATFCRSKLSSDIDNTDISFGNCLTNSQYIREFTIYNHSEIPLEWGINCLSTVEDKWRRFIEFTSSSSEQIALSGKVERLGKTKIKFTFQPKLEGVFDISFQICNLNDSYDSIDFHFNSTVGSSDDRDVLALQLSSHLLDFGDCYRGKWVSRTLTLKNTGDSYLDIVLKASIDDVKFSLANIEPKPRKARDIEPIVVSTTEISSEPTSATGSKPPSPISSKFNTDIVSSVGSTDFSELDTTLRTMSIKCKAESDTNEKGSKFNENGYNPKEAPPNHINYIDEIILKPGSEKSIMVLYRPKANTNQDDFNAGKLAKQNFNVHLSYFKMEVKNETWADQQSFFKRNLSEKIIQCKARACASLIEVLPKKLNFGDSPVGMVKTLPFRISNHSDLATQVELRYTSKVISCNRGPFTIYPNSSIQINVDLFPRKANLKYMKQIIVANLNGGSDPLLEIISSHLDPNRVGFHSTFYRIHTPTGANFLDLNVAVVNSPKVCNFVIENLTANQLELELSTTRHDIFHLFKVGDKVPENFTGSEPGSFQINSASSGGLTSLSGMDLRETILEKIDDQFRTQKKTGAIKVSSSRQTPTIKNENIKVAKSHSLSKSTSYLDLAQGSNITQTKTIRSPSPPTHSDSNDTSRVTGSLVLPLPARTLLPIVTIVPPSPRVQGYPLRAEMQFLKRNPISTLVIQLEDFTNRPVPNFNNVMAEEEYAKQVIQNRRDLEKLLRDKLLLPIRKICIPPKAKFHIILLLSAQEASYYKLKLIPSFLNAAILIKLLKFDASLVPDDVQASLGDDLTLTPVRELLVKAQIVRSKMGLGQRHFNFGLIDKDDVRNKMMVIRNKTEAPLIYMLSKSGSIASGDIYFEGTKYGVIRGFASKQVNFTYSPILPGLYGEAVIVRNIQDPTDDQDVIFKANIRKPSHFSVDVLAIDFGPCYINELCVRERIVVLSNTHKLPRTYEVRVDSNEMHFGWCSGEMYFYVHSESGNSGQSILSEEAEQEIEALEQKLKIARRKGREDKVHSIEEKLKLLKTGQNQEPGMDPDDDAIILNTNTNSSQIQPSPPSLSTLSEVIASPVPTTATTTVNSTPIPSITPLKPQYGELGYVHRSSHSVIFTVPGTSKLSISVWFKPLATSNLLDFMKSGLLTTTKEMVSGQLLVHEHRNRDTFKRVIFQAIVHYRRPSYNPNAK